MVAGQGERLRDELRQAQEALRVAEAELAEEQAAVNAFRMHARLMLDDLADAILTLRARKQALLRSITWPQQVPELCQEFLDTCLLSCLRRRQRSAPSASVKRRLVLFKKECWRLRKAHPQVREMCGLSE